MPSLPIGNLSPKMIMIIAGVLIVVCICFALFTMLQGPQDTGNVVEYPTEAVGPVEVFDSPTPALVQPTTPPATPRPSSTAGPTAVPGTSRGGTWLVMLYQDADDKILEQDIDLDLNEAERAGSGDRVVIISQMDRYRGGFDGDGNWTSTKRIGVTQDNNLNALGSTQLADLGEVNMSDGNTLVDFVTWAIQTYPADKYVLILSDHGMGWPGGWSDGDPGPSGSNPDRSIPLSSATGDELFLSEIDQALGEIRSQVGLDKFELIGMDACLMGHVEVLSALEPHARYAVVSQETEPSVGWAYASFLDALKQNPEMDGAELGQLIVQSYIEEDQRIVDDQARAEFLGRGSPMGGLFGGDGATAAQLIQQLGSASTLTAVDLSAVPELIAGLNDFSYALTGVDQRIVAQARTYAQSFTSVFGSNVPPSYIDLANFAQLLVRNVDDPSLTNAANRLLTAMGQAIIAEKHGSKKPGANGISVYFPNSQLYQSSMAGPRSYIPAARRFAEACTWDDFLAFHYTGRTFEPETREAVALGSGVAVRAPASGGIELSPIQASSNVAAPGKPVLLSTNISGENIGYVYLFVGYLDKQANSIFLADMDYLESGDTREIDGLYYPDWGQGAFTMEFEWEPLMFAIDDGTNSEIVALSPQSYGASPEEAVYTVDGTYTYAKDGESRYARLYFSNGTLTQVFGFTGEGGTGSPREITPSTGDTFTVLQKWMDLDQSGRVQQTVTQEGGTLTFGDQMFTWKEMDAAVGQYIVGFIVSDLDGKSYETYTTITVQ
jgi:Clostripain family